MIEFKKNGMFTPETDMETNTRVKIIGIGATGVNVLDQLVLRLGSNAELVCIDTDEQCLRGSVVHDKFLVGKRSFRGLGLGGDPELAEEIMEDEKSVFEKVIDGANIAVVVAGLGGGTGGGITPTLVKMMRDANVTTIVIGVTPLKSEGRRRLAQARQASSQIRKNADIALIFSNERIVEICEEEENIRAGFHVMNEYLGSTCQSLAVLMARRGLIQLNLSDLREICGNCDALKDELENCWIGHGVASGEGRECEVVEQALSSPLFNDGTAWEAGDRILVSIEGGQDLSVGEYQSLMEHLKGQMPVDLPIKAGATLNPELQDALALTIFVIRSGEEEVVTTEVPSVQDEPVSVHMDEMDVEEEPIFQGEEDEIIEEIPVISSKSMMSLPKSPVAPTGTSAAKRSQQVYFSQQVELPLNARSLRGRFEKSDPTIRNGQDLDQPTFMRLGIKIRV